ncbi:metallophosphoesterase [Wenzhouxiangella sp. XN79A]|uniref:metallophosphoesterase family protein n=1 Tax=Wenzhouxiangella sp. XN79A TaxID=2724193 RepID=UPI00144AB530|nr:metallophosphoesterase [Wenzhouxiangella sp. XN79A]NKI34072.1 metallophosphoesterase [Wenzhouxiangella sp. XN79A]
MRLAHLTDPHLTPLPDRWPGGRPSKRWLSWLSWQRRRRHLHRREQLEALVDAVRAAGPDAWAVTGDLCQTGTPDEIDEATAWLQRLAPDERVLATPGNHDVFGPGSRQRIDAQWAAWLHRPEDRVAVRRFGPVHLIAVDSAVVTPVGSARGEVGAAGRARLAAALREARGRFRVVLIHHPPVPGLCKRRKALADDAAVASLLHDEGAGLVLHGHLHHDHRYDLPTADGATLPVFCTPSASAPDAAARLFDIEPADGTFRVRMRLIGPDGVSGEKTWVSAG